MSPGTPATTSSRSCAAPSRRRRRRLPRVRRDAARPEDDVRAPVRGRPTTIQYPEEKVAGLPALPRAPPAAPLRGHRPGEVRRLLAVRRRLPGRLHPRRRRREHAGEPRHRRRALRRGLRDQPVALHLLRLLRGRVPVRRDHDGPRLRDVRLQPLRPHLHEGDAARRAAGAHAAAGGGRVASAPPMAEVLFFIAAIGAIAGAIGVVTLRNPFYSVLALVCHLFALAALFLLLRRSSSPPRRSSSTRARSWCSTSSSSPTSAAQDEPVRPAGRRRPDAARDRSPAAACSSSCASRCSAPG